MSTALAGAARRQLRVCMVHYSDFRVDSRIQRLARALAGRGDAVHAIGVGEDAHARVGAGSIQVHAIGRAKRPGSAARDYLLGYGGFLAGAAARVGRLHLRGGGLDLVEAHNMPDALVAAAAVPRLAGVPLMLNVHDTFPELFATTFGGRGARLMALEERASAAFADAIIVVTDEARARLASRGVGVGRTEVVMNMPDEGVFGRRRRPTEWPERGPIQVLYHGGLRERFGVECLIRAFALLGERVPRARLRVIGTGDERDALARLAAELTPGRVEVAAAPVPYAAIPDELLHAHLGVVPTLADSFTELLLPVKLLEYVHMGLPVACSRLPAIQGYFGADELRYFTPGSPHDLARALAELYHDPAGARAQAARAGARLDGMGWPEQRRRYLALVDRLTGSSTGAVPAPSPAVRPAAPSARAPQAPVVVSR
jgi:glycosyltransferase involved in cell wall biosynthesis